MSILARSVAPRFARLCLAITMSRSVTPRAQRNEILFNIISQPAAGTEVVDLKILRCAAVLAAPSIAREHRGGELSIRAGLKLQSRRLPLASVQG